MSDESLSERILKATEGGLPVGIRPYHDLAIRLGVSPDAVMAAFQEMLKTGLVRRIAAVPNHYRMGVTANAMTVWDVSDSEVDSLGAQVGALDFVSHCYRRPRHPDIWPYNLFAMVHGQSREECLAKKMKIAEVLGRSARASEVLFSRRILKKTGFRSSQGPGGT